MDLIGYKGVGNRFSLFYYRSPEEGAAPLSIAVCPPCDLGRFLSNAPHLCIYLFSGNIAIREKHQ